MRFGPAHHTHALTHTHTDYSHTYVKQILYPIFIFYVSPLFFFFFPLLLPLFSPKSIHCMSSQFHPCHDCAVTYHCIVFLLYLICMTHIHTYTHTHTHTHIHTHIYTHTHAHTHTQKKTAILTDLILIEVHSHKHNANT